MPKYGATIKAWGIEVEVPKKGRPLAALQKLARAQGVVEKTAPLLRLIANREVDREKRAGAIGVVADRLNGLVQKGYEVRLDFRIGCHKGRTVTLREEDNPVRETHFWVETNGRAGRAFGRTEAFVGTGDPQIDFNFGRKK